MTTEEKLNDLLKKRQRLYDKGLNDEAINYKIRYFQKILRDEK
jgi:hypothetical protein